MSPIDPLADVQIATLNELRRIREAIERMEHQQRSKAVRAGDVELCDVIDQEIGGVTFSTNEFIERSKTPKAAALRARLESHRVSTADRLGRRLGAIARRASAGRFCVRQGKRDEGGVLWSIEKVTPTDAATSASVTASLTALPDALHPAEMQSMKRATS